MKNKKTIIVFMIIGFTIIYAIKTNKEEIQVPNKSPIAYIYHSENIGMDAGNEYLYYIYQNKNHYIYEKKHSKITIKGSSKSKTIKVENINSKKDFDKIQKDIKKDTKKKQKTYIHYYYYQNDEYKQIKSIEELKEKLFP